MLALPTAAAIATAIGILKQRFGDRLQTGEALRRQHANTLTWIENQPPDAVLFVDDGEEVREVVSIAAAHRVPLIPFGAGTSLEGHVNAPAGGISLDFSRMDRLLHVNERDLDCVVEPGISRAGLNAQLRDTGLFFPVDPGRGDGHARRHGFDARFRHQRGALRHDARERPQRDRRDGRRLGRQDRLVAHASPPRAMT